MRNLNLEISILEAKSGFDPKIKKAKVIKHAKADPSQLSELREQKFASKLFNVKKLMKKEVKAVLGLQIAKERKKQKASETSQSHVVLDQLKAVLPEKIVDHIVHSLFAVDDVLSLHIFCDKEQIQLNEGEQKLLRLSALKEISKKYLEIMKIFTEKLFSNIQVKEKEHSEMTERKKRNPRQSNKNLKVLNRQISDDEDLEINAAESLFVDSLGDIGSKQKKKKNRPSQRARRAMWEKKYGSDAKHKQLELVASKNAKSIMGKGNVNEDLHPSWIAKRQAKQSMAEPFQGKKIKFEDMDDDNE